MQGLEYAIDSRADGTRSIPIISPYSIINERTYPYVADVCRELFRTSRILQSAQERRTYNPSSERAIVATNALEIINSEAMGNPQGLGETQLRLVAPVKDELGHPGLLIVRNSPVDVVLYPNTKTQEHIPAVWRMIVTKHDDGFTITGETMVAAWPEVALHVLDESLVWPEEVYSYEEKCLSEGDDIKSVGHIMRTIPILTPNGISWERFDRVDRSHVPAALVRDLRSFVTAVGCLAFATDKEYIERAIDAEDWLKNLVYESSPKGNYRWLVDAQGRAL